MQLGLGTDENAALNYLLSVFVVLVPTIADIRQIVIHLFVVLAANDLRSQARWIQMR